jgi:hypothetical protein
MENQTQHVEAVEIATGGFWQCTGRRCFAFLGDTPPAELPRTFAVRCPECGKPGEWRPREVRKMNIIR